MSSEVKEWYVRSEEGAVYGPASLGTLVAWAREGRVEPTGYVSRDRKNWTPPQLLPELEMKWLVETVPGRIFGPFNRELVKRLVADGSVPATAKAYRLYELPVDRDPDPVVVEKVVEKEVRVEVLPPARTQQVATEVIDPVADVPPIKSPGSLFDNVGRSKLAALEAAARRELAAAKRQGGGLSFGLFGGKRR